MELPEKLKKLMKHHRLSERKLSERLREEHKLDASNSTVHRWCDASQVPDIRETLALSRIFGVRMEMLADDGRDLEVGAGLNPEEVVLLRLARQIGVVKVLGVLAPIAEQPSVNTLLRVGDEHSSKPPARGKPKDKKPPKTGS